MFKFVNLLFHFLYLKTDHSADVDMGYKSFMDHIFSDNILFAGGCYHMDKKQLFYITLADFEAENLRRDLISLFSGECIENCEGVVSSLATELIETLKAK